MKPIKTLFRTVLAGLTALAILCVLILGYYYIPLRENNSKQNTDYVWAKNTPWVSLIEGVSFGMTDADGFINKDVVENPDILLLGSSHIESMNVLQSENMCALLNDKFDGKYSAYNMGISGHTIYKVVQYLNATLNIYQNAPKYVIIETGDVALTDVAVQQALSGEVKKTKVVDTGLLYQMQKVPYFRMMYHQLDTGMLDVLTDKKKANNATTNAKPEAVKKVEIDEKPYDEMLGYLQKLEKEYDTQIIVMFHPFETINADGSISFAQAEYAEIFSGHL